VRRPLAVRGPALAAIVLGLLALTGVPVPVANGATPATAAEPGALVVSPADAPVEGVTPTAGGSEGSTSTSTSGSEQSPSSAVSAPQTQTVSPPVVAQTPQQSVEPSSTPAGETTEHHHTPGPTGQHASAGTHGETNLPSPNPGEPSTTPPSPNALFGSPFSIASGSPVLNLFLSTYRTPPFLLPIYLAAAQRYGVPWQVLAAVNEVESDYGFDLSTSSAGAEGWMQFLPEEWLAYGVDANGTGVRDPYNPADAIFAAARYLAAAGAATDLRGAIYAYNHSSSYVESVILRSQLIAATPQSLISGLTAIVAGRFPVEGSGPHATTAVWSSPSKVSRGRATTDGHSAPKGAPAPAPALAAAASSAAPGSVVTAASIAASAGAPVVAVQNAEVVKTGHDAALGRFIELRDAFGDNYTYAGLGGVLRRYSPSRRARGAHSSRSAGAPLRRGAWVAAGTTLGNVPYGAAGVQVHFVFQIRPAGAGAIDPRPLLRSWQLLGETQGHPLQGAQPLFGPDSRDALISEIQLLSEQQLQARLIADGQLRLDACARQSIFSGQLDRRVLATVDFLLASGLDPAVSAPDCAPREVQPPTASRAHASGETITITQLNGLPIAGNNGQGSLAELAARRLLSLPAAMRPKRIAGSLSLGASGGSIVRPGPATGIEISFKPQATMADGDASGLPDASAHTAPGRATGSLATAHLPVKTTPLEPLLGTAQWRRLLRRISALSEPHVTSAPTSAAVPDSPSSPLPRAEAASAAPPPAVPPAPATGVGAGPEARNPPATAAPGGQLNAPLDIATPLASGPSVVLETPGTGSVLTENTEDPELRATATGLSQATIAAYEFQYAEAESAAPSWTTIATTTVPSTSFETTSVPNGLYNVRVIATTAEGQEYEAELRDRLVANSAPVVTLADPGLNLRGAITLSAEVPRTTNSEAVTSVTFQWARATPEGGDAWQTIESGDIKATPGARVRVSFNTESLPDGSYDLRVVPEDEAHETFAAIPVRARLIDNTPPRIELSPPRSPLSGQVTLSAKADDPGSGVALVRFQARSRAGVSTWKDIGQAIFPTQGDTYTHTFASESLANGAYDFRAIAADEAGNEGPSATVENVGVDNASLVSPISASIAGVVAPAEKISFLGAIAGSSQHEAWAYGFTSAPPAEVDGVALPYEAQGEQLVLLRYTDAGGWQIADVLREADGKSAFRLLPAGKAEQPVQVAGAMAPSGEAWLWVGEKSNDPSLAPVVGLFHRRPGGSFELDQEATSTLGPLVGSGAAEPGRLNVNLRLGESAGQVYGMLTAPGQPAQPATIPGPGGSTEVHVNERLEYGLLKGGKWTREVATPPAGLLESENEIALKLGDVAGPGKGWGAFQVTAEGHPRPGLGLVLGQLEAGEPTSSWTFPHTGGSSIGLGLDALDLTGTVAAPTGSVEPTGLKADGSAVWIEAALRLPPASGAIPVVARYDGSSGEITNSWCTLPVASHCREPLDLNHPAAVPDAIFETDSGPVALALRENSVAVFSHGEWSSVAAPGYGTLPGPGQPPLMHKGGEDLFSGPDAGWVGGPNAKALGQWSAEGASSPLSSWPLPDRAPLTSVALTPGGDGAIGESGALAVGFEGTTLSYDAGQGWLIQPAPPSAHHLNLLSVAFAGASSAYAVGQFGVILHWNGTAWSEDPQSISLTSSQLNAVAFSPSGEGWAVGANGTILHYDGHSWSIERPPSSASGVNLTSVTVAGSSVFAVAGGNLITRPPHGGWEEVAASQLPSPAPKRGSLRLVSGLPDGGLIAAGSSVVLLRENAGSGFAYAPQPLQGLAVALAPFREADGGLRAYVSVAPSNDEQSGSPPGDGELMRQTATGWQDLSRAQYAGSTTHGDGEVKSDPVLAVASGPGGKHAWAVGGYDGTKDAASQGTNEVLQTRPAGWQSASIWRYDTTRSAQAPKLTTTTPSVPAKAGTVSFAFFTSPMCREECAHVLNAQPDVNLTAAAKQIAGYASQPGGPAFAMLGGNAVGPVEGGALLAGNGRADFARLPELLAPLGSVPTFAALGRFDNVPTEPSDETRPWAEAFSNAPPPFGSGPAAAGITSVSSGKATHEAHLYYAFDTAQNGGRLRTIVLDNSKGSLEASAGGQRQWLLEQLEAAHSAGLPVVVMTAIPLRAATSRDGEAIALMLAEWHVLAVFTTNGALPASGENAAETRELDEHHAIPEHPPAGVAQIPEYEGASLGYQQPANNGVKWYFVSIDTHARTANVAAIPVIDSLSLKATDGLSVARSLTLKFEAVGRRPTGSLASKAGEKESFPGYDRYVQIPAPNCGSRPCVQPSYAFTSSEPAVGDFVEPSGEGSPLPKLDANKHPIPSSSSGLFCAYNSGTTTITVSAGELSYSLPVTVQPGGFGSPCGTVFKADAHPVILRHSSQTQGAAKGAAAPPAPPPAALSGVSPSIAFIPPPPPALAPPPPAPAPKPVPAPAPAPPPPPPPAPQVPPEQGGVSPAIVPPATPPVEPIPPGGTAQAPSAAERKEKARKHASQSAFTIRPAGTSAEEWFYGALAITSVLALLLSARALPIRPRSRPALLGRTTDGGRRRKRR
jgi:hypothetical protein